MQDKFENSAEVVCIDASESTSLKVGETYIIEALYQIDMHGARFYWVKGQPSPLKGSRFVGYAADELRGGRGKVILDDFPPTGNSYGYYDDLDETRKPVIDDGFVLDAGVPSMGWGEALSQQAYLEEARKGQLKPPLIHDELDLTNAGPAGGLGIKEFLTVVDNIKGNAEAAAPSDPVVLPDHYARFAIEPIRFICENNLNFFQGNIVKYILRHDAKNGMEDLKKAQRYLTMFMRYLEEDPDWWRQ